MTIFIILCVLMCLVAVLAVAIPLWRGGQANPQADRREQVLAILRQQAADLEAEHKAGRIDTDEYEESRLELERRVLEEAREEEAEKSGAHTRLARQLAVFFAVLIPCATAFGYFALGRYTAMDPAFVASMQKQGGRTGHSAVEMQKMLEDLKAQLDADPANAQGWFMLARTAASVNRFDEAVEAYRHLNKLVPGNADLMADMADMMAAANGKVITPDVEKLLHDALKIDPDQWKALALLAIQAWDKEQYARAAEYWEHLVRVVPPDFPDVDQIRANIAEAKRLGGVNDNISEVSPRAADRNAAEQGASEGKADAKLEAVPTVQAGEAASVSGSVVLTDALKSKASPEDTVFIYARPETSRMPVAFMKVKVKDLPFNFKLDETMTMAMGADTLSSVKTVIVGARISKTGNFMPQSGDLEGEMPNPVEVGDSGLVVQISNVRP